MGVTRSKVIFSKDSGTGKTKTKTQNQSVSSHDLIHSEVLTWQKTNLEGLLSSCFVLRVCFVNISGKFAEQKIDFVKIDVEGFECKVFKGASKLLQQKPRIIQSEVWGTMQGCTPRQYVQLFMDAGYHLTRTSVI